LAGLAGAEGQPRWLLLRNDGNIAKREDPVRLQELLKFAKNLKTHWHTSLAH
jgi:hypothetical protein